MTSYRTEYLLTSEQKKLLRDLLIYVISECDSHTGKKVYTQTFRRSPALELLNELTDEVIVGDDRTIMFMEEDIIKLCNPISDDIRQKYNYYMRLDEEKAGLNGILHLYSNEVIEGLKSSIITSNNKIYMASTSSFCNKQNSPKVLTNFTSCQLELWDEQKQSQQ